MITRRELLAGAISGLAGSRIALGRTEDKKVGRSTTIFAQASFHFEGNSRAIYTIDPVEGTWARCSESERADLPGRISPDGKRMAWQGRTPEGKPTGIFVQELPNGESRILSDHVGNVCWSPDGSELIVGNGGLEVIDEKVEADTWRVDVKTGRATKLPIGLGTQVIDWSRDGKTLLAAARVDGTTKSDRPLIALDLRGENRRVLFDEPQTFTFDEHFSVDGHRVHYSRYLVPNGGDVSELGAWTVTLDGSKRERILEHLDRSADPLQVRYSPDGKLLAAVVWPFDRGKDSVKTYDRNSAALILVDRDGKNHAHSRTPRVPIRPTDRLDLNCSKKDRIMITRREWLAGTVSSIAAAKASLGLTVDKKDARKSAIFAYLGFEVHGDIPGIYEIDPEEATWIKRDDKGNEYARLSPNGEILAYPKFENGMWRGIFVRDIFGGDPRKLTELGRRVCWSPDGSELIVGNGTAEAEESATEPRTWRVDFKTGRATKMPIEPGPQVIDWSRDGKTLLARTEEKGIDESKRPLIALDLQGKNRSVLFEDKKGYTIDHHFAPDGRRTHYTRIFRPENRPIVDMQAWVVDNDGSKRERLLEHLDIDADPFQVAGSPDGKRLAAVVSNWSRSKQGAKAYFSRSLIVLDRDGKTSRKVELPSCRFICLIDWR